MRSSTTLACVAGILTACCSMYAIAAAPGTPPATRASAAPAGATATPAAPAAVTKPATAPAAAKIDATKLDDKGYIRQWLILGPIYFGTDYSADNIEKEQITGETTLAPKEGDK